jgi:C_GCAxxG_C_C family probable redox protein
MMTKYEQKCKELHDKGFNCSQTVACTFCEDLGFDMETVFRLSEGFGLGVGCAQGICGAVSGAAMIAGMIESDGDLEEPKTKRNTYARAKHILRAFNEEVGAVLCKDIKGRDESEAIYPCDDCIALCVRLVEEEFAEELKALG